MSKRYPDHPVNRSKGHPWPDELKCVKDVPVDT